ncbi:FHA domain-containing protein [Flavobacteriaceae bacterium]|nr:FHA domain-containing protein [Flavobacteriaceae bacterium]|tara:strand:- start:593 stop:1201 length:609 start_codon:yes stop_codon:yes gene_type:complete
MKGFKQCEQGHFYNDSLSECNYCPKNNSSSSQDQTELLSVSNNDQTVNVATDKTQVFGGTSSSSNSKPNNEIFDPNRTTIGRPVTNEENSKSNSSQKRKLRGWLVSFDIEDFGVDFKLFEGRNSIGSKSSSDITIQDPQVSSLHGLILYKKNKFILTDELSTNGTFLNGEELIPRNTYDLNDGDEIKTGDTTLLFKTAFKIK